MEVDLVNILVSWLFHIDPVCVVCNWDPAASGGSAFGGFGAAAGTGIGLNDLFGGTNRLSGVGDTADPTYSSTTADDQIASDEQEQQRINDYYRATHPGATTAGPPPPTIEEVGAHFIHRALDSYIKGER